MTELTPIKSIRNYCIECSGGSKKEVRACAITDCPLYEYRLGINPHRLGIGNILNLNGEVSKQSAGDDEDIQRSTLDRKTPTGMGSEQQQTNRIHGSGDEGKGPL